MNTVIKTARWLQLLPFAVLTVFFAFPVLTMAVRYARFSDVMHSLTDSSMREVWWFTLWQAVVSTVLTVLIALPVTWAVSRHTFRFSHAITGLVTIPFLMPAVVVATGVRAVLSDSPVTSILWAHLVFNVAVVVRLVGPRWALIDPTMEDTAADLGATPFRTFIYVVFPHIRSALRNAASMVFLFCFTSFAVIAILGGVSRRTVESEIFTQAVRLGDTRTATSLAVLQAIVVLTVLVLGTRGVGDVETPQTISVQPNPMRSSRLTWNMYLAAYVPLLIVMTPLIAVVVRSFRMNGHFTINGYKWLFDGTTEQVGINFVSTVLTSLTFALVCASVATVMALVIATARMKNSVLITLTALPLAVSAVTLGLGLIVTFNEWPMNWRSERWLIPVIHAVIALPLAVRVITPAVHAIPEDLHNASSSLGAGAWRTWWKVDVPLIRPALTRAFGIAAAVSLGEFGATSFLSRSGSTTIPIAIGQLLSHPGDVMPQTAFALVCVTIMMFLLGLSLLVIHQKVE